MNFFLGIFFVASLSCTLIFGTSLYESGFYDRDLQRLYYLILLSGLLLAILAFRWEKPKKLVLYLIWMLVWIEAGVQLAAITNLLPAVSTFDAVPFGRTYWTKEGFSNSTNNAHGWHYPTMTLSEKSRKIAIIGDSFIEGLQIGKNENVGIRLENLLASDAEPVEVFSLGRSSMGPGQYLEMLKFAYRHYGIDEAILSIYLGNDFSDNYYLFDRYKSGGKISKHVYYHLDSEGHLALTHDNRKALDLFKTKLDYRHGSVFLNLPSIISSHYLTVRAFNALSKAIRKRTPVPITAARNVKQELELIGLKDFIFRKKRDDSSFEAFKISLELLVAAKKFADANGIVLRVVDIAFFPPSFYSRNDSVAWSSSLDDYDFLRPEKLLEDALFEHSIQFAAMGDDLRKLEKTTHEIKEIYLNNGSGHLSADGHRYLASLIYRSFYSTKILVKNRLTPK